MKTVLTKASVLALINKAPKECRPSVACALLGHSKMQYTCWGYYHCGRCDAQVGDSLGSCYPGAETAVIKEHGCETCRKNAKALSWQDKLLLPPASKWMAKATCST